MEPSLLRDVRGFTLVELLVAITILAIGLLSIAGMQVVALKTNASANTLTTNAALAEGILEEILSWNPSNPLDPNYNKLKVDAANVPWVFDGTTTAAMNAFASDAGGSYTATYSVDAKYNGFKKLTRIEVKVKQTKGNGRELTLVGFKRLQ